MVARSAPHYTTYSATADPTDITYLVYSLVSDFLTESDLRLIIGFGNSVMIVFSCLFLLCCEFRVSCFGLVGALVESATHSLP